MIRRSFYRHFSLFFLLFCMFLPGHATHQKAAELLVRHVSGYTYRAMLFTYTFTQSPVDRPEIELNWGDGSVSLLSRSREEYIGNDTKLNYYEAEHTYAGPGVYVLFMEDPNRNSGVVNMPNSILTSMYVSTTITISPWLGSGNSSPVMTRRPVDDNACLGQRFMHNPAAYDPDGDSLSYRLIPCRTAGGENIPGFTYPAASDTLYMDSYTGDLIWDAPMAQGEYNIAILLEEWRNRIKIGDVTRDMQIVVRACDNNPPQIEVEESYCVEAGQVLLFPAYVRDQNRDMLSLTASGEMIKGSVRAGLTEIYSGIDSAVYDFYWVTSPEDARQLPYKLYLRAVDNGDPNLSSVRTVSIKVLAPAVQFTYGQTVMISGMQKAELAWNRTLSPHASGYALYRRDFWQEELPFDSCRTGISDTAYRMIASLPLSDTAYADTDLEEGMEYCYKVVVLFPDGAQSRESDPLCVETLNISPLLTEVSVEKTDIYEGAVEVSWLRPKDVDSSRFEAYRYRLYGGHEPENLEFVAEFPFDSCVRYSDRGRNTEQLRYFYRVELDSAVSRPASSVYLTATGRSRRVELTWGWQHPWRALYFDIYRYEDSVQAFRKIGRTEASVYTDRNLEPDRSYRYYVEAAGSYGSRRLPDTLPNRSNSVSVMALPGEPCRSYLFLLQSACDPLSNTLVWDFDSTYDPFAPPLSAEGGMDADQREDCRLSVDYYEVYRKQEGDEDYRLIATVQDPEYRDTDPGSLFCCYMVKGIGENEMESAPSNELCTDNWDCFRYDLPNVFTPNGDGVNDVLRARDPMYIRNFTIRIVNRWGVEVFKSSDPAFEWNGCMYNKGKDCPEGAYFYMAEFQAKAEGRVFKKVQSGSITLLR